VQFFWVENVSFFLGKKAQSWSNQISLTRWLNGMPPKEFPDEKHREELHRNR
jgi:hypothetical protein